MASSYQQFVKAHMAKLPSHMSAKEKMVEIGKMWRQHSGAMPKAKKAMPKASKKEKGGSLLGNIIPFGNMLGLGLDEKKMKKGKKAKKAPARRRAHKAPMMEQEEHAGSIFGDIIPFGNMLGLGLEKPKSGRGRGRRVKGGVISGAGVSGGVMSAAGLHGLKHLSSPIRGHSVHNNPEYVRGSGFGDYFFKGLTAPFRLAAALPIPGLQQIGQIGDKAFAALGV